MITRALVAVVALTATLALAPTPAGAGEPCCAITAIDAKTGEVAARDVTTGVVFRFPASEVARKQMKVGQRVDARFIANTVGMSGRKPVR